MRRHGIEAAHRLDRDGAVTQPAQNHTAADPDRGPAIRLATLPRGEGQELRVEWSAYKGYYFVGLRQWFKTPEGDWRPDGKRGISIKRREIKDVLEALSKALELASRTK